MLRSDDRARPQLIETFYSKRCQNIACVRTLGDRAGWGALQGNNCLGGSLINFFGLRSGLNMAELLKKWQRMHLIASHGIGMSGLRGIGEPA